MENEFSQVMSQHTDEQLIKIVSADRSMYVPEAIAAASLELEARNIETAKFLEVSEVYFRVDQNKQEVAKNFAYTSARIINYIIDSVASFGFVFFVLIIFQMIFNDSRPIFTLAVLFGSYAAYFIIMELLFQKTLGKFITKTKVVTIEGYKPNQKEIVLRTVCRFIPFDPISFMFMEHGFHDLLSKTRVIKD